jgi:hypothetical protein
MPRKVQFDPNQTSILDYDTAHARREDPETSHAAAEKITPQVSTLQQVVLGALSIYGPTTDRKLITILKARHGRTESTWRTRRSELVGKGLVEKCGVADGRSIWRVKL